MLDAIERQTRLDEERRAFASEAQVAREEALKSGMGYTARDVHRYLARKVRGKTVKTPKPRAWHK